MPDTEQKILAAALKVFAEKGYKGATTKVIADESGFSEFTLFRKFKSKENLFELVLLQGAEDLKQELLNVLVDSEFEDTRDFLVYFVTSLDQVAGKNFDFLNLSLNDGSMSLKPFLEESLRLLSQYIQDHLPGQDVDYQSFALTIFAFIYMVNLDRYHGRSFLNHQEVLEGFIDNLDLALR
ncbi:MAG: TetR/AcrR family transcriptional regulator [Methanobacteriaceae archaeon]